ncbi:MAG: DUF1906 domain-containing protein [Cohnella sp.]|nr:DUF1906 domain-containing protein [Cohnella sp.]
MAKGFDCATSLTAASADAFRRDGMDFVCRYLVPPTYPKALTRSEAEFITKAGLNIVSVWQIRGDLAAMTAEQGRQDGERAQQCAKEIGQPVGTCIYFAVDFDATDAQLPAVIAYIAAAAVASPEYATGVYGSYRVVEAVRRAGACSRAWQTYAWSGKQQSWLAQIYQYRNDIDSNGIKIDLDSSYGNEGWWSLRKENEDYMMKPEDANKVITFMKAAYEASADPEGRDEFHRLANELRKASGQPEE